MNPDPILQLDKTIHEKGRLAIMSLLAASPNLSFTEIRDTLGMTDGNVTAHMRTLQQAEYVAVTKAVRKKRSLTTYSLTQGGLEAFETYLNNLEAVLRQTRPIPSSDSASTIKSKESE